MSHPLDQLDKCYKSMTPIKSSLYMVFTLRSELVTNKFFHHALLSTVTFSTQNVSVLKEWSKHTRTPLPRQLSLVQLTLHHFSTRPRVTSRTESISKVANKSTTSNSSSQTEQSPTSKRPSTPSSCSQISQCPSSSSALATQTLKLWSYLTPMMHHSTPPSTRDTPAEISSNS